jgi:surface antigen
MWLALAPFSLLVLVPSAALAVAPSSPAPSAPHVALSRPADGGGEVSRSSNRTPITGTWQSGEGIDAKSLSAIPASNARVREWVNGPDEGLLPSGFGPDHPTGDTGNAYEFSQCTWWAYTRRHQLGLPVGSHFGNGDQWADSAKRLGYWVDNAPRHVGDVMVFAAGQDGSDAFYGHVAIVESIAKDGSITTSESGAVLNGRTVSRTFSAKQAAEHLFIHY